MAAHPGFQAIQAEIAKKQGIPPKAAGAILAATTRKASPAAKKKNSNLKNVAQRVMKKKAAVNDGDADDYPGK